MSHQPSSGPGYPSIYPVGDRQSAGSTSLTPQTHLSAGNGSHTLPPIGPLRYVPPLGQEIFSSRAQPLQPSLVTSGPGSFNQPMPIYGPTSTTYFVNPGPFATYAHPSSTHLSNAPSASQYNSLQPSSQSTQSVASQPSRLLELRPALGKTARSENFAGSKSVRSLLSAESAREDSPPIHVVGSQGRRGILPSSAGRPPAIGENAPAATKGLAAPTKDAGGKFPCEHCPKVYLHIKHLKRHMLRHTGDRPYTCGLCRETFSRSDILKRHFQKCSVRRGNPSGQNHLYHSRKSKQEEAEKKEPPPPENTHIHTEQPQPSSAFTTAALGAALDLPELDLTHEHLPNGQRPLLEHLSRSDGVRKHKSSRNSSNRGSMGGMPTSAFETNSYGYSTGHVTPESITTSGAATPYTYSHEARSNQISPEDQLAAGIDLPTSQGSRPSLISSYSTGSLPHIMGQPSGRGPDLADPLNRHYFHTDDDFIHPQYHSGTVTPQQQKEGALDFITMNHNYNFLKNDPPDRV